MTLVLHCPTDCLCRRPPEPDPLPPTSERRNKLAELRATITDQCPKCDRPLRVYSVTEDASQFIAHCRACEIYLTFNIEGAL